MLQAINTTLKEKFRDNPDTFIWGQDMANKDKGGIFNVTKGMQQEFGETRVFNGPIAEDFILGHRRRLLAPLRQDPRGGRGRRVRRLLLARGRADRRDVPRLLADQRAVRPERDDPPRLRRLHRRRPLPLAEHRRVADHAPGHPRRRARLRRRRGGPAPHGDPLERGSRSIWSRSSSTTSRRRAPASRAASPCPSARRASAATGRHLTILAYGTPVHFALEAAATLATEGTEVEVIDLRSLVPLDFDAIVASVKKTSRVAHRPRGQGLRRLRRRDRGPDRVGVLRPARRPRRARRLGLHARRLQPDPRARHPPQDREAPRAGPEDARVLSAA